MSKIPIKYYEEVSSKVKIPKRNVVKDSGKIYKVTVIKKGKSNDRKSI